MRVGMGYDVHRLVEDRKLIIGGVEIPYEKGLLGHSDAPSQQPLCNVDFAAMELLHARLVRTTTCVNGCKCDYTICGDKDPYVKEHPEYRDENGYRRNK